MDRRDFLRTSIAASLTAPALLEFMASAAAAAGTKVLRIGYGAEVQTLDPIKTVFAPDIISQGMMYERLLKANAENLQEANKVVREEMERGVFDIDTVKAANDTLIATINESLAIADAGKAKRAAAEAELVKMEAELRDTLASAKARQMAPTSPATGA